MNIASKEINAWALASRIEAEFVNVTKRTCMNVQARFRKIVTENFINPKIYFTFM